MVAWQDNNSKKGGITIVQSMLQDLLFEEFTDGQVNAK